MGPDENTQDPNTLGDEQNTPIDSTPDTNESDEEDTEEEDNS